MARPQIDGKRVHVILTMPQYKFLSVQARKTGLTMSDLIRRAVDTAIHIDSKRGNK